MYTVCELEGAPTIRNGGLCVTGALYAAKSDITANRHLTVDGSFALAAGANVVVDGLESMPANGKTGHVIVTDAGGVSGEAIACSPDGPVRGWIVRPSSATTLSLFREVGFTMAIR